MSNQETLNNFIKVNPSDIFIPEGRFRPLNKAFVKDLAESIQNSGQLQPIQIDKNLNLIDGNHRVHACISLGIQVEAKIVDELDPDKIALIEIDSNLTRKELTQRELEEHLVERKKIYLKLFPNTAKGKKREEGDPASFVEDTAEKTGKSKRTIERAIKRGTEASDELKDARDNGEINNAELDKVICEAGTDAEEQKAKLVELLQAKKEAKDTTLPADEIDYKKEFEKLQKENKKLQDSNSKYQLQVDKLKGDIEKLRERIALAKQNDPKLKI